MVFNSFSFIVFFIITLFFYYILPHRLRWVLLLLASAIFYMAWSPLLMILLLFSVSVNYAAALRMDRLGAGPGRRFWLVVSLVVSFGILFVFKYLLFFANSVTGLLQAFGIAAGPPQFSIILPMGISFYTFQAAGYAIDVYRGNQTPQRNFFKFTLFITFFPQLVAGPIERADNLMPQLFSRKTFKLDNMIEGAKIMIVGFFKKVVVADRVAACVNTVYNDPRQFEGLAVIIATVLFAFQIYCDFSGYSDIAQGCSKMLGIDLMRNFRQPYLSRSIKEFWRRWHVSLSSWFKDYVYFPLGGSRVPKPRHYFNTMVTFLVSGLWHGADWTFVIWGGLHGAYQITGDMLPKPKGLDRFPPARAVQMLFTFALVCFSWIFFRANSIGDALYMTRHLFTGSANWTDAQYVFDVVNNMGVQLVPFLVGTACILLLIVMELFSGEKTIHEVLMKTPGVFRFGFYFFLAALILCLGVYYDASTFIYFQF